MQSNGIFYNKNVADTAFLQYLCVILLILTPMTTTISKYGITLRSLSHSKIELVRHWRNHPSINQYMEYRGHITPEMQEAWFQKISASDTDFYFIIEYQGRDIGLINIKDISYEKKCGEPGIFVWDSDALNTGVSFLAVFALDDFCMETLGLETVYCHILRSNKRAIRFNKYLGYQLCPGQENLENQLYSRELIHTAMRDRILRIYAPGDAGQQD